MELVNILVPDIGNHRCKDPPSKGTKIKLHAFLVRKSNFNNWCLIFSNLKMLLCLACVCLKPIDFILLSSYFILGDTASTLRPIFILF